VFRAAAALAAAALACASAPARSWPALPEGLDDAAAREALRRFAAALDAGRFDEAHALLSARWQAAYDSRRLALDFAGAGPRARDMVENVLARASAGARIERSDGRATMSLDGAGKAVVVAEGGAWRVEALE
jgi:hypothetical protein